MAGISRLHLVKAHSVMDALADFRREQPHVDVDALARTSTEADIDELIGLTMGSQREGIAVVDKGTVVGVVTLRGLLRGVKGGPLPALVPA